MAYTSTNFKTKKAFREAVAAGVKVTLWSPGIGTPAVNGREYVEGPHYPKAHTWYAEVEMKDGVVVGVK